VLTNWKKACQVLGMARPLPEITASPREVSELRRLLRTPRTPNQLCQRAQKNKRQKGGENGERPKAATAPGRFALCLGRDGDI
jgi:hypothetical protein